MKGNPDDDWVQSLNAPDHDTEDTVSPGPWLDHLHEWPRSLLYELAAEIAFLDSPVYHKICDELDRRRPPANTFCARVRKRLGLSQAQLTREIGVGLATIKSVESGRRLLPGKRAWALIRFARANGYLWHWGVDESVWDLNLPEDIPEGDIRWKPVSGEHSPYGNYPGNKS